MPTAIHPIPTHWATPASFLEEGEFWRKNVKVDENFAENLLEKLITAEYSGAELVAKFKEVKQKTLSGTKVDF